MGHINKLVNAAMPEEEEDESEKEKEQRLKRKSTCLMSNVNANIMSLNGLLQQLNQLPVHTGCLVQHITAYRVSRPAYKGIQAVSLRL